MSLFQNWSICADYFGDELLFPLPSVKTMKQKERKNVDSTTDYSKNRALTVTPSFDGLFHFETKERKKEKKNADINDTKTATDNIVVVSESNKDNSSKKRVFTYNPAFDGLFPFEAFVSR